MLNTKTKKILSGSLALLLGVGVSVSTVDAAQLTKNIKAIYNNIKITYDGKTVTPIEEPFMINGRVYVSLRDAGQITGNAVNWNSNTVHITSQGNTSSEEVTLLQRQLDYYRAESERLKAQVSALEAQLKEQEDTTPQPGDIDDALKMLVEEDYDIAYDVDWTFDLEVDDRREELEFIIEFDGSRDGRDFRDISSRTLEKFVEDMCEDLSTLFKDYSISGAIEDYDTRETVLSFSYDKRGRFEAYKILTDDDARDLAYELRKHYTALPLLDSGELSTKDIKIENIIVDPTSGGEEVSVDLSVKLDTAYISDWRSMSYNDQYKLESFMENIIDDIEYEYNIEKCDIYIRNTAVTNNPFIAKYINGDLTLYSY